MPYIKQEDRTKFSIPLDILNQDMSAGELNYCITRLCVQHLANRNVSYTAINEVVGVLECAKQEFYRRLAWYEDQKRLENGEVFK